MNDRETSVADVDRWHTCRRTLRIEETELTSVARIQSMQPREHFSGGRERLTSYLIIRLSEDGSGNQIYVSLFTSKEWVLVSRVQGE